MHGDGVLSIWHIPKAGLDKVEFMKQYIEKGIFPQMQKIREHLLQAPQAVEIVDALVAGLDDDDAEHDEDDDEDVADEDDDDSSDSSYGSHDAQEDEVAEEPTELSAHTNIYINTKISKQIQTKTKVLTVINLEVTFTCIHIYMNKHA